MTGIIEQARKALEGATPGPWENREHCFDASKREVAPVYDGPPDIGYWSEIAKVSGHGGDDEEADEAFSNACLMSLAPDLARIAIAADELAKAVDHMASVDITNTQDQFSASQAVYRALETYFAAKEGRSND